MKRSKNLKPNKYSGIPLQMLVVLGFILLTASAFRNYDIDGFGSTDLVPVDSSREGSTIEVFTAQKLVVSEAVNRKTTKRTKFKARLSDCFKIVKYGPKKDQGETEWQPSLKYGVTVAGFFKKGDPEYPRLDSLLLVINQDAVKRKRRPVINR